MPTLKSLLRNISYKFPDGLGGYLLSFCKGRGLGSLYSQIGIKAVLAEVLFRRYTGNKEYCNLKKKLEKVRKKDVITVVFQVWNLAKWKCNSVYHAMKNHPRFNPVIWMTDEPGVVESERFHLRKKMEQFFCSERYSAVYAGSWQELDTKIQSDIVFLQDHYPRPINNIPDILGRVLCYVRYCFPVLNLRLSHNFFLENYSLFYFIENSFVYKNYKNILSNRGRNMVVTGHPIIDTFSSSNNKKVWKNCGENLKKIIWAPHWTINNDARYSPATFLKYAQFMVAFAQKYKDKVQIVFKPHPMLYRTLCEHSEWGKERTDAYYSMWNNMTNTQLEEGDYTELFMQSDAMIHDCGSFILEYLAVDKPCMFLKKASWAPRFSHMGIEALKCYTMGHSEADIESFILDCVLGNKDPMRVIRHNFVAEYLTPPNSLSAADNIIKTILEK